MFRNSTNDRQFIENNPCNDCKESAMSMTCRCKEKIIYDYFKNVKETNDSKRTYGTFI